MNRLSLTTISLLLACLPLTVTASAGCRAGEAAAAGSQAGYDLAKKAAEAWSQREDQVSVSLGECLGDISTQITMPQFPNLSGILGEIEEKVCRAAQSEIDDYVPDTIDPWGDMSLPDIDVSRASRAVIRQARQTVPVSPQVAAPSATVAPPPAPSASPEPAPASPDDNQVIFSLN